MDVVDITTARDQKHPMTRLDLPAADLADLMLRYQEAHTNLAQRTARIEAARNGLRSLYDLLREGYLPKVAEDGATVTISMHDRLHTFDGAMVQTLAADLTMARQRREELSQIVLDLSRAGFTRFDSELAEHDRALGLRRRS